MPYFCVQMLDIQSSASGSFGLVFSLTAFSLQDLVLSRLLLLQSETPISSPSC